jgi:hypothetical protein
MTMQNDDDLRERFRALSSAEETSAPRLSHADIDAWRSGFLLRPRRSWRAGTVAVFAAGAVVMLTIGLVLGASTGYASAEVIIKERGDTPLPNPPAFAVLRNIPPLMFSCGNAPVVAQLPPAPPQQQGVPIIDLPGPTSKTSVSQGGVLGVRQVSNGNIIVNDAGRRQIKLFDSTLNLISVVRDSAPGSATSYGSRRLPMIPYLGDSSLIGDYQAGTMLVMGPTGQIARAIAPSLPNMLVGLIGGNGAVDDRGRILVAVPQMNPRTVATANLPDTNLLIRADLDTRGADTLARMRVTGTTHMMGRETPTGPVRFSTDPVPLMDDWAYLSDGSIAIVRGSDYHIDWILRDGTTRSTPKLPFDWKRLTDEDKQRLIDSTRDRQSPIMARALGQRRVGPPPDGVPTNGRGGGGTIEQGPPMPVEYVAPALSEMFDFYPPLRRGALRADLDGNLWILPSSSAQAKQGELIYDVVNAKGDFHRVRFPVGKSLAGFGKGGVVFMLSGDAKNGFYIEKTQLPAKPSPR